jgi:hypothetical protein
MSLAGAGEAGARVRDARPPSSPRHVVATAAVDGGAQNTQPLTLNGYGIAFFGFDR